MRHLFVLKEMTKGLEFGKEVVGDGADEREAIDLGAVTGTFSRFYVVRGWVLIIENRCAGFSFEPDDFFIA